jgi:transcriptional regulator with PAS, ATPase and Fis domain
VKCALDDTMKGGTPQVNLSALIISKSGIQKHINISTAVLRDEAGKVIGGVETFRDLTDIEKLRREIQRNFTYEDIVGRHPKIKDILSFLPDIAESDCPVLIEGPTGSGKELIARAIHNLSRRKDGPFIEVNCAALPDTLIESEMFGYRKGAFTGAIKDKAGRFFLAHRGTIFLDEISNTSRAFQADLLRVLEDREFIPLGDTKPVKTDFRIIAATNRDLKAMITEGSFREDLYYRLNVVKISLPPLRQRKEDIPLLIDHFIRKFNLIKGAAIQGVSPEVLSFLMDYPFPGNVRELENIIEYAFISCKGHLIEIGHLPDDLLDTSNGKGVSMSDQEKEELQKIRTILDRYPKNRLEAARALEMSRTTLWRKMKKYRLI